MKKNVIIIALLLITAYSMTLANIKANDAERALRISQEAQMEALKQTELANQRAEEARMAQVEAERAMEKFLECQYK